MEARLSWAKMEFGTLRTEPTLQTYISKCAWCEAWQKHNITEYGKYYCVNVDNAVYQGFRPDFVCTPTATSMSWGGDRCEFDWGHPLSPEEVEELAKKKAELGSSCMKDFNFHTAHLKYTVSQALIVALGEKGEEAVKLALADYVNTFGQDISMYYPDSILYLQLNNIYRICQLTRFFQTHSNSKFTKYFILFLQEN
ncbi:MAG: L-2-amino-thiazoline-4-carboxylic acid hydrolase [Dorea sp.]